MRLGWRPTKAPVTPTAAEALNAKPERWRRNGVSDVDLERFIVAVVAFQANQIQINDAHQAHLAQIDADLRRLRRVQSP